MVRTEEWLVRRVDPSADGGHLLTCDGLSELVRGSSALFLTELEGPIEILDPATTVLTADISPQYAASLLAIESQRRRSLPNDVSIRLGHKAAMNVVPYQLDPALQALRQPRARILIADAVGLARPDFDRLSVAYGLSMLNLDRVAAATPTPRLASEASNEWQRHYIDKDQV